MANLGVGQIAGSNRVQHMRTQRKPAFEEYRTARRTFRHGPSIAKPDTRFRNGVDVRCFWRCQSAITERRHLINAHIIHNDEKDIWIALGRPVLVVFVLPVVLRVCQSSHREQKETKFE
jgi:hypothetical protein